MTCVTDFQISLQMLYKRFVLTNAFIHTYIHAHVHTYFLTYMHTYIHTVACRLPETSPLLTYLILDRKGLVSGSDFPYLRVCRRSVAPCSCRDDVEAEAIVLRLVADYGS